MGEIIAFQSPASSRRAQPQNAGEGAQILFFTGVRYVPRVEAETEPATPNDQDGTPRGGRRRRER